MSSARFAPGTAGCTTSTSGSRVMPADRRDVAQKTKSSFSGSDALIAFAGPPGSSV